MLLKHRKPNTLAAQIKAAEQQVLNRKQKVSLSVAALAKQIHLQMTTPTTLLLSCGIGFILGEATKRQSTNSKNLKGKPSSIEVSPLTTTLNLILSAHMLYKALPLTWLLKTFSRARDPEQASERYLQPGGVEEIQPIMGKNQNHC